VAEASIKVNKETDFSMILPSEDPEVQQRQGIVVFIDKDHPDTTKQLTIYDSLSQSEIKGIDVNATIETDSSAKLTLIIDERSGDALTMQGNAHLSGGMDKSGKISLTGNYMLTHGSYQVSLSVLKKKFEIQPGSLITWTGDPMSAIIDIKAVYNVKTAPIDLVQQQLTAQESVRFKQQLPFQVMLNMKGELLKPVITFDIVLPEAELSQWPEVNQKLEQVRTDESEMNKQVFALLLLNHFVQENPFQSAAGGTSVQDMGVQSVSRLLSNQLNQLAASLIKGVDINFDINSEKDYSTGVEQNRTDVNVSVSKKLLNDRLVVNVGSNVTSQGSASSVIATQNSSITGNFSIDYKLSKNGKYMVRAYRQNDTQEIIEGQVIETGVSFILTLDYDQFRELFQSKKKIREHNKKKTRKEKIKSKTQNEAKAYYTIFFMRCITRFLQ